MIHRFSQSDGAAGFTNGQQNIGFRSDIEKSNPLIQVHDPESKDHGFASSISEEMINISGAAVIVYARTASESFDKVYEEDPDPTYKRGVHLKGFFVPKPLEEQLTPYGVDAPNQTTVVFSKQHVFGAFGNRMITIGDVIELPYNASSMKIDRFRVLNTSDTGNYRYQWLYFSCIVENITDDITIEVDGK